MSAGCAVCVKKGVGMSPHPDAAMNEASQCRFKASWIGGLLRGGFHCASIYLKDSEGASERNLNLLQEVAIFLSCLKGPWIIGGDWNMAPQVLERTQFVNMVRGVVVAPSAPTCNASVYDYFVVSEGLLPAVAGVARIEDAGLNPHWPVRLYLRGDARKHLVRQLIRPAKIPGVLPHGPSLCPPSYENATPSHVSHEVIDKCTSAWYENARKELRHLMMDERKHASSETQGVNDNRDSRFKWVPAAGAIANSGYGFSSSAHSMRGLGAIHLQVCAARASCASSFAPIDCLRKFQSTSWER